MKYIIGLMILIVLISGCSSDPLSISADKDTYEIGEDVNVCVNYKGMSVFDEAYVIFNIEESDSDKAPGSTMWSAGMEIAEKGETCYDLTEFGWMRPVSSSSFDSNREFYSFIEQREYDVYAGYVIGTEINPFVAQSNTVKIKFDDGIDNPQIVLELDKETYQIGEEINMCANFEDIELEEDQKVYVTLLRLQESGNHWMYFNTREIKVNQDFCYDITELKWIDMFSSHSDSFNLEFSSFVEQSKYEIHVSIAFNEDEIIDSNSVEFTMN
jgi:hypothetical protein